MYITWQWLTVIGQLQTKYTLKSRQVQYVDIFMHMDKKNIFFVCCLQDVWKHLYLNYI